MAAEKFTLKEPVEAEIVEKKSRFIAQIKPVATEEAALDFIAEVKKKHAQARHNVYAYIVGQRVRFTDDGEPSGTSGKPTLETLEHANLDNVACVVTRYFGGTLLGTGGLVRAYSGAVKAAIEKARAHELVVANVHYEEKTFECTFSEFESLKRKIESLGGIISDIEYSEKVVISARVPID